MSDESARDRVTKSTRHPSPNGGLRGDVARIHLPGVGRPARHRGSDPHQTTTGPLFLLSTRSRHAVPAWTLAFMALTLLAGCSNLGYYMQSVGGQLDILRRQRPIEEILKDPAAADALKRKLATVLEIRA